MSDLSVFSDLCLAWAGQGQKKRLNSVKHADTNGTRLIEAGSAPPFPMKPDLFPFIFAISPFKQIDKPYSRINPSPKSKRERLDFYTRAVNWLLIPISKAYSY